MSDPRARQRAAAAAGLWYRSYLVAALPMLLIGFGASVMADRLIFAAWGFASALAYGLFLRRHWPQPPAPGQRALLLACTGSFTWLVSSYYTELKLGLAALLPAAGGLP